jgi:hypothetical protein
MACGVRSSMSAAALVKIAARSLGGIAAHAGKAASAASTARVTSSGEAAATCA